MKKYPIVILPGWMLGAYRFAALKEEFEKEGFSVHVVDFPGFERGETIIRPWFLQDYVDFLKAYLQKEKIKQAILACHSFGGRVALKFTLQYPEQVKSLIISGTPGFTPVPQSRLKTFIRVAKLGGMFFSVSPLRLIKNEIRKLYYWVIGAKDFYHANGFMRETFKLVVLEDLEKYMKKIDVPTLLLWGEKDSLVPVKIAQKMKRTIKDAKLVVISNSGHMLPARLPERFVKETETFLANIKM